MIEFNINEIFAIRAELGINQNSVDSVYSIESANNPISDPFDEMILCHLGVGESREQKEMLPTEENLLRVEAKRKWVSYTAFSE